MKYKNTIKDRKKLHKKLWELRSILIRKRENGICYTCGVREWNNELGENDIRGMQAGHFRHGVLDFDDINIHCQCIKCNHFLSGNLAVYSRKLISHYGLEEVERLHQRADMAIKGELYDLDWYLEEIEKTKQLLK